MERVHEAILSNFGLDNNADLDKNVTCEEAKKVTDLSADNGV
jgi:hypothetical protein